MKRSELVEGTEYAMTDYRPKRGLPDEHHTHRVRFVGNEPTFTYTDHTGWGHSRERTGKNGIKIVYLDGVKTRGYRYKQREFEEGKEPGAEAILRTARDFYKTWEEYAAEVAAARQRSDEAAARRRESEQAFADVADRLRSNYGFEEYREQYEHFVLTPQAMEHLIDAVQEACN